MKPPKFDGKTNYLLQFEAAANGRKQRLCSGVARWSDGRMHEQLVKHLETRFRQAFLWYVSHSQLRDCCQQPKETQQEFEVDIACFGIVQEESWHIELPLSLYLLQMVSWI